MKPFLKIDNLKGDLFGGITAGIVALPLALAFGIQAFGGINDPSASSLGAIAGLVGAMLLGFFASIFGGTPSQISGPTGPMTVITASLISGAWTASTGNISAVLISMSMAGMLCGLFQILFGVIKIGKYIRYIPYPVLSGFMSGIGAIIILQQIYPLIGHKSPVLVIDMLLQFPETIIHGISVPAIILGMGTILIIQFFPLITKKIPSTLVALIVMTVISLFMDLDEKLIIGSIPAGLPVPFFAKEGLDLSSINWWQLIKGASISGITLACLGSIDTLLTSVVADNITKTKHNSNKELIGQGIGNAMAGMFCGIAGAGATMRTVVNVNSGGRGRMSGMVHSLLLLAVLLGLGSLVKYVPLSVLAGILIMVGVSILDMRGIRDLLKMPKSDSVVGLTVFFVTVLVDLLTAVGIGMVMACILFMKRMGDLTEESYETLEYTNDAYTNRKWDDDPHFSPKHKVVIKHLEGPLFFGSIQGFKDMMMSVPKNTRIVIVRMKKVTFMDQSGLYAMETAVKDLQAMGITVMMTMVQEQPMTMMTSIQFVPTVLPNKYVFSSIKACSDYVNSLD